MSDKHGEPQTETQAQADTAPAGAPANGDATPQAAGDAAAATAEALANDPELRLAAVAAERDELRDKLLRALAEAENVRRRADRDRRDAETYGVTRLARDLLTIQDNLDRALAAATEDLRGHASNFVEGVELTQRELLQVFQRHKIEKVVPEKGEKFDPNRHQAMFEAPIPGAEPGTVIEVMQAGFVIADRLLRPAMVGVAKAAPDAPADPPKAPESNG